MSSTFAFLCHKRGSGAKALIGMGKQDNKDYVTTNPRTPPIASAERRRCRPTFRTRFPAQIKARAGRLIFGQPKKLGFAWLWRSLGFSGVGRTGVAAGIAGD